MDPNKALETIRENAAEIRNQDDDGILNDTSIIGALLESWEALDEWLTHEGFLPVDWTRLSLFRELLTATEVNVVVRALEREKVMVREQVHAHAIRAAEGAAWIVEIESAIMKIQGVQS